MDKKYGDKYGALRAAAAARQRQRDSGHSSSSKISKTMVAGGGGSDGNCDADGNADASGIGRYRRLQQLQRQQEQRQRGVGDHIEISGDHCVGGDGGAMRERTDGGGAYNGGQTLVHDSSHVEQLSSSSLPPRRPDSSSTGGASASSTAPESSKQQQSGGGVVSDGYHLSNDNVSADSGAGAPLSTPVKIDPISSSSMTPMKQDPQLHIGNHGNGTAVAGEYHYATPTTAGAGLYESDVSDHAVGGNVHNDGQGSTPPPPKTPLTMMRSVRSLLHKDRREIEGRRKGVLFNSSESYSASQRNDGGYKTVEHLVSDTEHHHEDYEEEEREMALANDGAVGDDDVYSRRHFNAADCVPYGSEVLLRFRNPTVLASISLHPQEQRNASGRTNRVCIVVNEAHGMMGGIDQSGENRFVVAKAVDGYTAGIFEGEEDTERLGEDLSRKYLCYGDRITLRSGVMRRVLGVQKEKVASNEPDDGDREDGRQTYRVDVGCFRREGRFPPGNTWTVHRGGANAPVVRLGPDNNMPGAGAEGGRWRIPMYSGDPIVLRNDWTGGLLSLGRECRPINSNGVFCNADDAVATGWSLEVITSTYQMNSAGASTKDGKPLVEYLHEQDKCCPRKTETFQIVRADAPYCPRWVYPTAETDRVYLTGSYLDHLGRHGGLRREVESETFPKMSACEEGWQEQPQDFPLLAELSVDLQERVLLEEVVGAMMGQEGWFLRYRLGDDDEDDLREEEGFGGNPEFVFAPALILGGKIDSSLENIVSRLLPLCTNYVYVNHYVLSCLNRYECGAVARTLSEALNVLLEEYLRFVSNLNYLMHEPSSACHSGPLNMSMIHVRARPSIRTMAILSQAVSVVRGKKGGELLNSLCSLASLNYSGDRRGSELLQSLLTRCARPYANMLWTWIQRGKVHDPHGEFMIEVTNRAFRENNIIVGRQGMEWTEWCRERGEHVLGSLHYTNVDIVSPSGYGAAYSLGVDRSRATSSMSALHKAHATGKYWRAIHCCHNGPLTAMIASSSPLAKQGKKNQQSQEEKESTSCSQDDEEEASVLLNPLKLSRRIDLAYHEASDTLLRILLDEYGLLSSLRFMKKYFLLDQGDFFVDFLDGADDELHKELPDVLQGRVQNRLTTSVARTSEATESHLASALRCAFKNKSLRDTLDDLGKRSHQRKASSRRGSRQKVMSGFEAIAFEFRSVPFPTSIVLSHDQLRIYQLVFRLVFFAKYVERRLVGMWSDHQMLKAMSSLRSACGPTFSLRRRMLHFIQNFVYYLKFDVIEPSWRELEGKLKTTGEYCRSNSPNTGKPSNQSNSNNSGIANNQFPRTVDDLLHEHNSFLLRISSQCLLTNYDLIDRASKIMTTCLLFSIQIRRFMETTRVRDLHERTRYERSKLRYNGSIAKGVGRKNGECDNLEVEFRASREERTQRCSDRILHELCTETYRHMITRFDEVFSAHLAEFMKSLNGDQEHKSNAHLANLSMQLDYNGFVSSSIFNANKQ